MSHYENQNKALSDQVLSLKDYLYARAYPGRGVLIGRAGEYGFAAYFITGRSEASCARVLVETPDGVRTQALGGDGGDPALLLYHSARLQPPWLIVTNGDQTDTVHAHICRGESFEAALNTRTYEPDAPHYTPRVSGLLNTVTGEYRLALLSRSAEDGGCLRAFHAYAPPAPDTAHILHTYADGGDPLPPFSGAPVEVRLPSGGLHAVAEAIYESLPAKRRVAVYASAWQAGACKGMRIINRHTEENG